MLKNRIINKSARSIGTLLCASTLATGIGLSQPAIASEPFLAEIVMFGGNFNPRGWAFCNGQILSIAQNSALFSLLGTTYGGDGRTTFALPDLRGRVAVHSGGNSAGPGLPVVRLGERGGSNSATLNVNNLPAHSHTATATLNGIDRPGNTATPGSHTLASKARTNIYQTAAPEVAMQAGSVEVSIAATGNNQSFSIRNPYLGINFIIATQGTFPSRN